MDIPVIKFQSAEFATSAPSLKECPEDSGCEVAFAGRSNAGKSSAINTLTRNKSLARTSKTPGRTQMINFFTLSSIADLDPPVLNHRKRETDEQLNSLIWFYSQVCFDDSFRTYIKGSLPKG